NSEKHEIFPVNDIYTVQESNIYELSLVADKTLDSNLSFFIEDVLIERRSYEVIDNTFFTKPGRFFQDYFGFASLSIADYNFKFNIQVNKLTVNEIEDIMIFLWENEERVFNNFFSKSTLSSKISNSGAEFSLTSKFLNFANHFADIFSDLYPTFVRHPFTRLKKNLKRVNYS